MFAKPMIGLTADFRPTQKNGSAFSYVAAGYYDAISRAGGLPIVLPPLSDSGDMERFLDMVDGMLFVGGGDLDPRRDGFMLHPSLRLLDARREKFERELMALAVEKRVPLMGIGTGMQLLNVTSGGNLFLHIPEDLPKAIPHQDPMDPGHRHSLVVEPGSLLERIYGDGEIRVNSYHHMAVDEVAPGFSVTARCPDGVIEAIESEDPGWFAIGTQFHPESDSASAVDIRIFEEFVEAVGQTVSAMRMVA